MGTRRAASSLGVGLVAGLALATCGGQRSGGGAPAPASGPCNGLSMPRALIGPDVSLRVLCGGFASAAVASIDQEGSSLTTWKSTLAGDPAFSLFDGGSGRICAGTAIVRVQFQPPLTAVPGDSFDAVVTIRAGGDAFPAGTVKVHGVVALPSVTVDQTVVDFGALASGVEGRRTLTFRDAEDAVLNILSPTEHLFPFEIAGTAGSPDTSTWVITVAATDGDYEVDTTWTDAHYGRALPSACFWSKTIPLRVHVLPLDAGVPSPDGSANDDAGADRLPDTP